MRAALIAVLLLLGHTARADDTFEARAQAAQRINHVEDVIWALTAKCDAGDDTHQRQCRTIRDEAARELAGATVLVTGDETAFEAGGWNPSRKSVPLRLAGCVACTGVSVDGKAWYVGAAGAQLEGKKLHAANLYDNAKAFPDESTAIAFIKTVRKVRVELLVKLPAKPKATGNVLAVDIAGFRVIDPCNGSIVIANPPSGPVAAVGKACVPVPPAHP